MPFRKPKDIAISETKDLITLTTVALFRKLREHELEMIMLEEMDTTEKKNRRLALRTNAADEEYSYESSGDCSGTENLNLLIKRFEKFMKMKGKVKN